MLRCHLVPLASHGLSLRSVGALRCLAETIAAHDCSYWPTSGSLGSLDVDTPSEACGGRLTSPSRALLMPPDYLALDYLALYLFRCPPLAADSGLALPGFSCLLPRHEVTQRKGGCYEGPVNCIQWARSYRPPWALCTFFGLAGISTSPQFRKEGPSPSPPPARPRSGPHLRVPSSWGIEHPPALPITSSGRFRGRRFLVLSSIRGVAQGRRAVPLL
ncbi:hypothetical protein NDU88_000172 [Pleurodeles waltl]|uniref:Uncharacterized protein n=1 Tax=Pleurodeles waltl TaxID=8319 RepID=A0AAV7S6U6_PLEWA|nr:hypothetical protein NDU88_000172 [Pleurodeles waltl]